MNETTTLLQAQRQGGRAAVIFLGLALLASTIYVKHHALLWHAHPLAYGAAMLGHIGIILGLGRKVGVRILIEGEKPLFLGAAAAFCVLAIYSAMDSAFLLIDRSSCIHDFMDAFGLTFLIGSLPFGAMGLVLGMHLHLIRN